MIIAVNIDFKQLERRSLKKIRALTGFKPVHLFFNLKYIQKLETSYEIDVRLIFTRMYGGFTESTKHASAAALIHGEKTLYWHFT